MRTILLVEDEASVASFIIKGLSEKGYSVSLALNGTTGLQMFEQNTFSLVILDIMLPEMNGLELCKAIRAGNKQVPILFLTALGTSENIVVGLEAGGDDYLVKPFKFIELEARIKSLLRRTDDNDQPEQEEYTYRIDDLSLNDYTKVVERSGKPIALTSTEYMLLLYFLKNRNKVLSRMEILENVWGIDFNISTNVVDVYINYLRKKIDSRNTKLIHTVVGMGYVLREENPKS